MDEQMTRLNRIEEKLDKVGEAVVSLARMEERMITLFKRMDSYDESQRTIEGRLNKVELGQASNAWIERLVWLVIGIAVTYLVKQ